MKNVCLCYVHACAQRKLCKTVGLQMIFLVFIFIVCIFYNECVLTVLQFEVFFFSFERGAGMLFPELSWFFSNLFSVIISKAEPNSVSNLNKLAEFAARLCAPKILPKAVFFSYLYPSTQHNVWCIMSAYSMFAILCLSTPISITSFWIQGCKFFSQVK